MLFYEIYGLITPWGKHLLLQFCNDPLQIKHPSTGQQTNILDF